MSGSLPGVARRRLEQLAGERPHPAALCGREGFILPDDVARIAQAAAETCRVGQRPHVRPEVPPTGRKAAGDGVGEVMQRGKVDTTKADLRRTFELAGGVRLVMEAGTHSPWVSRLLQKLGHETVVANRKQVKLITESSRKDDRLDAQTLARLARIDPQLLRPIQHRSEEAQGALMIIRVRAALMAVRTRTYLINPGVAAVSFFNCFIL